jgi:tetratricopeptide (TPR) repeat protein
MSTNADAIQVALAHHQAGRLDQAAAIYRQVLAENPRHASAVHLLGIVALQSGDAAAAVTHIRRAIELDGQHAAFHANLGEAYRNLARWAEAQSSYERALQLNPHLAEAHCNLGVVLEQLGKPDAAVEHYEQTVAIKPDFPAAQRRLGLALRTLGRLDEAAVPLARAIALNERDLESRFALANVYQSQQRWPEAEKQYRAALAIHPHWPEAMNGLGVIAHARHRPVEAISHYAGALQLRPDYFEALYNWGIALAARRLSAEAVAKFREAIAVRPDSADAHCRLGTALQWLGRLDDAAVAYRQALQLRPNFVVALCNLGTVLHELGQTDDAITCFENALQADPNSADTYNNLGNALQQTGHSERALACYQKSLQLAADLADAHHNLGLLYLGREQFAEGWREYAWRLRCEHVPVRPFEQPLWQGEALDGRTLLLHAEQGFGDTIQMLRYVALACQRGGRVLLEVQPQVVSLVRSAGLGEVLPGGGELPSFDVHAPLLSLPGIFHADARNMADGVPYLKADPRRVGMWREKLADANGLRIGIAWQGNTQHRRDRTRSIPLACFAPLADVPGIRLLSLQKDRGTEQLAGVEFPIIDLGPPWQSGDFLDTAAVIENLDLVITCDTALAHLTGALGARGWVALSKFADWRWFEDRDDSPWYPSLRLFRQQEAGDWGELIQRMARAVSQLCGSSGR